MTNAEELRQPAILIACDRETDGADIARALAEEHAKVHFAADEKRHVADFERLRPGVLVLAFGSVALSRRLLRTLRQPETLAKAPPHRVLLLCGADELRDAYELCKADEIDDFVPFWPRSDEWQPLRMAVRRGLRLAEAERSGIPAANDFALLARRLGALEPLLRQQAAALPDPLKEALAALNTLARRCPPRVLVVDDDPFQLKLLERMLADEAIDATFARSAGEALAVLHRRRHDVVLMDIRLPDADGVETTRQLKAAAAFAAIPVIMITGSGGREIVVESLKAGAADFVVKPLSKAVLMGKVRRLIWGPAGCQPALAGGR